MKIALIIDFDYDDLKNIINFMEFTKYNNKKLDFQTKFYIGCETTLQRKIIKECFKKNISVKEYPVINAFGTQYYTIRDVELIAFCDKTYLFCNSNVNYFTFLKNYAKFRNYNLEIAVKKKRILPPVSCMMPRRD